MPEINIVNDTEKEIKGGVPSEEKEGGFEIMSPEEVEKTEAGWQKRQEELKKEGYEKDLQFLEENKENISPPLELEVLERAKESLDEKWGIGKEEKRESIELVGEEKEKKETLPRISGFEYFDAYNKETGEKVRGREILEKAVEFLPRENRWMNVKEIKVKEKIPKVRSLLFLGRRGRITAEFKWMSKTIVYYPNPNPKKAQLERLPFLLAHEWAHSIDPQFTIEQKDLSNLEKATMIREWEKVRKEESSISFGVREMKLRRRMLKHQKTEDFAETVAYALTCPYYFELKCPKRYNFCIRWLKKRFPEFTEKYDDVREKYELLLSQIKYPS